MRPGREASPTFPTGREADEGASEDALANKSADAVAKTNARAGNQKLLWQAAHALLFVAGFGWLVSGFWGEVSRVLPGQPDYIKLAWFTLSFMVLASLAWIVWRRKGWRAARYPAIVTAPGPGGGPIAVRAAPTTQISRCMMFSFELRLSAESIVRRIGTAWRRPPPVVTSADYRAYPGAPV